MRGRRWISGLWGQCGGVCLLLASGNAWADELKVGPGTPGESALPDVIRVAIAGAAPEGVGLSAATGYGFTEAVLGRGDAHHQLLGVLAASVRTASWLSLGLRLDGRYDIHTEPAVSNQTDAVGDPRLWLRAGAEVAHGWHLGSQVALWIPGRNAPSLAFQATSLDALALGAYHRTGSRVTFAGHAGFRLDNSAQSAGDADQLSRAHRLALGVSDSNAVLLGAGVITRLSGRVELLAEATWDLLVGREAPSATTSPIRIAAGSRVATRAHAGPWLQLVVEVSPSRRPIIDRGQPLVPVAPRVSLIASVALWLGPAPAGESGKIPDARQTESGATRAILRGRVLGDDHQPLAGAKLTLSSQTGEKKRMLSDARGNFEFTDLEPGEMDLDVEAEGRKSSHVHLLLRAGESVPLETLLTPAPITPVLPLGQIQGIVRDLNGRPVLARIRIEPLGSEVSSDAQGGFRIDVPPGNYEVVLKASGFVDQRRKITVDREGVVLLNVDLRVAP